MSMNQNYIHTITLYNRIQAADSEDKREHWQRTVIYNCFWKSEVKTSFSGTQASVQNTYVVRIPDDERYLPYAEYAKNPGFFTGVSNSRCHAFRRSFNILYSNFDAFFIYCCINCYCSICHATTSLLLDSKQFIQSCLFLS